MARGSVSGSGAVMKHADRIGSLPGGVASCQPCHGTDYRGTVLSRAQTDRNLTAHFDTTTIMLPLFRGALIGCYNCHNGPGNDSPNTSATQTVANVSTNTTNDKTVAMVLTVTGAGA